MVEAGSRLWDPRTIGALIIRIIRMGEARIGVGVNYVYHSHLYLFGSCREYYWSFFRSL